MRHLKKGRKFGRERNQRRALMKSLASSFFMLGRIKTTEAKAKELRPFVEKFITRAKNPAPANGRLFRKLFAPAVVKKIMELGRTFSGRAGGYTRIVKLGVRISDGAKMAIIELVK
ncbi:MAG: 50S ribosomal protein L17 [Candidatus Sungbacteria bacterium]|nr:50S ribosomal protein L17 [Candidatus Sungbacteria bacterium]